MEEKNICELSDEALAKVAGGGGNAGRYVMAMIDANVLYDHHHKPDRFSIGTLNRGDTAPYLGEDSKESDGLYHRINFKGRSGWVSCTECKIVIR